MSASLGVLVLTATMAAAEQRHALRATKELREARSGNIPIHGYLTPEALVVLIRPR